MGFEREQYLPLHGLSTMIIQHSSEKYTLAEKEIESRDWCLIKGMGNTTKFLVGEMESCGGG